jgi:hypothetical protein
MENFTAAADVGTLVVDYEVELINPEAPPNFNSLGAYNSRGSSLATIFVTGGVGTPSVAIPFKVVCDPLGFLPLSTGIAYNSLTLPCGLYEASVWINYEATTTDLVDYFLLEVAQPSVPIINDYQIKRNFTPVTVYTNCLHFQMCFSITKSYEDAAVVFQTSWQSTAGNTLAWTVSGTYPQVTGRILLRSL